MCRRHRTRNRDALVSRHVDLREPTPLANLHLTILDKIDAKQESFGDSTGLISGV